MTNPKFQLLSPTNSQLIFIDQQPKWPSACNQSTGKY